MPPGVGQGPAPAPHQGPLGDQDDRRPGRGLVIAGSVLIVLAVAGGVVGGAIALGRLDLGALERDVVVDGPAVVVVPNRISFEVQEPLDDDADAEMSVGVAVARRGGPVPTCTLSTEGGEPLGGQPVFDTQLIESPSSRFEVVTAARVSPGSFVAECTTPGEPSGVDAEFTVGRVLGREDVDSMIGPVLAALAVGAAGALMLVLGVILLVVGIVRGRRQHPGPPWGGPGQPWPPQAQHPGPQQWYPPGPPPGQPPGPPSGPPQR